MIMMMMMMVVMVTRMVNIYDDDCDIVMNVILVKEVMPCDVSPVAMFDIYINCLLRGVNYWTGK